MNKRKIAEILPNATSLATNCSWTHLHEAAARGDDIQVQKLLITKTCNIAVETSTGNTALHEAASRGYSKCVQLICDFVATEKGEAKAAFFNVLNFNGLSALHLAVQNGHNQSCRVMLLAGVDPNIQNSHGDCPLHTACRYGHIGVARILISAFCNPNKRNLNGDTALHVACAMGKRKLCRILLASGANLNIQNQQNETPYAIALRKNLTEILLILRNAHITENERHIWPTNASSDEQCYLKIMPNWSPYGCHYFSDFRTFHRTIDILPIQPLKSGEQYFLDLAGNVHKGPKSSVKACHCKFITKYFSSQKNSSNPTSN